MTAAELAPFAPIPRGSAYPDPENLTSTTSLLSVEGVTKVRFFIPGRPGETPLKWGRLFAGTIRDDEPLLEDLRAVQRVLGVVVETCFVPRSRFFDPSAAPLTWETIA